MQGQWEKMIAGSMQREEGQWRKSKIAVDCKCRGDEGQWEKSKIAVDCKCREMRVSGRRVR